MHVHGQEFSNYYSLNERKVQEGKDILYVLFPAFQKSNYYVLKRISHVSGLRCESTLLTIHQ